MSSLPLPHSVPCIRTPSPDPSIIARDFAPLDVAKRFRPPNMPDISVTHLYLDYTPVPTSGSSFSSWFARRKSSRQPKDFQNVRLLVLDKPPTQSGSQGYSISLHLPPRAEEEKGASGEEEKKGSLTLLYAFAFYMPDTALRELLLNNGIRVTGQIPGNWQEEVGTTDASSETIARESQTVYKHYLQNGYTFTPNNCRLFCNSVAGCIQSQKK